MELFPAFTRFVNETGLADKAKGNLSKQIPRILGQGTTKTLGLDRPPAPIERKLELASLTFPEGFAPPPEVEVEVRGARGDVVQLEADFRREEGKRRFATACLKLLNEPLSGFKDGQFYAGRLILKDAKKGMEWSWRVTPHYEIVGRIPPDEAYVALAYQAALARIHALTLAPEEFEDKLELSWLMARHFRKTDDVPLIDVMKMYVVAGQDARFWQAPKRLTFKDLPDAAFAVNLIAWRSRAEPESSKFEFVPATLHQTKGAQVFFMPMNAEGTEVRPMVSLRRRT